MRNSNLLFNNSSEDSMWIKRRNDKKFLDKFCESKCDSVAVCWQINRYSIPTGTVVLHTGLLLYSSCPHHPKTRHLRYKVPYS